MGTGTALVAAEGDHAEHILGTGVGGGTLLGLSNRMLKALVILSLFCMPFLQKERTISHTAKIRIGEKGYTEKAHSGIFASHSINSTIACVAARITIPKNAVVAAVGNAV